MVVAAIWSDIVVLSCPVAKESEFHSFADMMGPRAHLGGTVGWPPVRLVNSPRTVFGAAVKMS